MNILVLPGDGIGPEITAATVAVLEEASQMFALDLKFRSEEIGFAALEKRGTTLPASVLEAVKHADGVILGPISHLDYPPRSLVCR